MEVKENVYISETQTGTVAEAEVSAESEGAKKEVSTVLGKFKDVDALVNAYSSLQAEFTRRSQRLKELERRTGERCADKGDTHSGRTVAVEKLRKNAVSAREEGKKFSSFVAELEQVGAQPAEEPSLPDSDQPQYTDSVADNTDVVNTEGTTSVLNTGHASVATSQEVAVLSAEQLFEEVSRNEEVRLKVIGEYLASLKKSGAPLMTGGVSTLAAPPLKAKSVKEAGNMALRFFKNNSQA